MPGKPAAAESTSDDSSSEDEAPPKKKPKAGGFVFVTPRSTKQFSFSNLHRVFLFLRWDMN